MHIEGHVRVGMKDVRIGGHREVAPPHLPDVLLKEAQIASQDGGVSGAGFFKVLLDNKNPFPVTIDRFQYTVSIKGKQLEASSGTTSSTNDEVPASAVAEYEATVDVNEKAFGKELKALLKSPTVPYVIEGELEVRGIKKPFRFAGEMKFAR
jgi:LEA14-like dessication related protein